MNYQLFFFNCSALTSTLVTEEQVKKLKEVFEILDVDHSGEMDTTGDKKPK